MVDLYEKKNPFVSIVVEPSYGISAKDLKNAEAEENLEIASDVATSTAGKGTPDETLALVVSESGRKLGLEDLNAAIDSTEVMDVDNPNIDEENVINDLDQTSPKKSDDQKGVRPDVGTSLHNQDKQEENTGTPVEDESEVKTTAEKEAPSNDTTVNFVFENEKLTEEESDPEQVQSDEKEKKRM